VPATQREKLPFQAEIPASAQPKASCVPWETALAALSIAEFLKVVAMAHGVKGVVVQSVEAQILIDCRRQHLDGAPGEVVGQGGGVLA
jgi:hypothetical protein